ncbi:DUF1737 domain-containing protein [Pseudarthrobacter sp. J64]|uniref:DUF1737 domain-containing protein n=1 Tax=Pseudarthrobacter sp. J64 TaxID=3116485 RepID=UPI002E7FF8B9|nr:DUF1737 domain-containing protein [Pseudarthrobacter sp. J64]MEE2568904.1 DUF1737 domain-containing protein [Pseudarthrobacter sp. J64]
MSDAPATSQAQDQTAAQESQEKLAYRLITGPDDRTFCERISAALAEGYVLHGSPAATFNGTSVIVAQAVILPSAIATADAAVAIAVDQLDTQDFSEEDIAGGGHA